MMVRWALALMCVTGLSQLAAAAAAPKPSEWLNSLAGKLWTKRSYVTRNVMVVSQDPERQQKWDQSLADVSKLSWFQYLDKQSSAYIQELNPSTKKTWDREDLANSHLPVHLFFEDRGTELVASLYTEEGIKDLGKWPLSDSNWKSSAAFLDYLNSKLGYEAIVLDTQGEFLLAALLVPVKNLGQGILIKGSVSEPTINAGKAEGEALLQMVDQEGPVTVLELLSQKAGDSSKIQPGSKIILGQNKNLDRVIKKYNAVAPQAKP